jgi:hypothetical protein
MTPRDQQRGYTGTSACVKTIFLNLSTPLLTIEFAIWIVTQADVHHVTKQNLKNLMKPAGKSVNKPVPLTLQTKYTTRIDHGKL